MSLAEGSRLGPYEIVAPVGAGGMGEVYKARDTRLDRTVAIKVLPPHFVGNEDLWILCTSYPSGGTPGLVALPADGERTPVPLVVNAFTNIRGRFSPDGRFVVYQSDESGRVEVYVQPFPSTGAKWQISTAGGRTPFWTNRGRQIVFLGPEGTSAWSVTANVNGSSLEVSLPRPLFERSQAGGGVFRNRWVPTAAGDRFLVNAEKESTEAPTFHVVLDWPTALSSR